MGKCFADVTFLPRKNANQPAIIIELKLNKREIGAIKQIESNKYHGSLSQITDSDVILYLIALSLDFIFKLHPISFGTYSKSKKKA